MAGLPQDAAQLHAMIQAAVAAAITNLLLAPTAPTAVDPAARMVPGALAANPAGAGTTGTTNRNTGKFAWKAVAPKTGEAHEKSVNGKAYVHCPHHPGTSWVLKINRQGVEHKTGCRMMAGANAKAVNANRMVATVATIEEEMDEDQI
jgi:hypothetical protein